MSDERRILKLAKKLNPLSYRKIKKIKDKKEKIDVAKYIISSVIEKEYLQIQRELKKLKITHKDEFYAKNLLMLVPAKLKYIKIDYNENDINKTIELFNKIKKEIKNARPI